MTTRRTDYLGLDPVEWRENVVQQPLRKYFKPVIGELAVRRIAGQALRVEPDDHLSFDAAASYIDRESPTLRKRPKPNEAALAPFSMGTDHATPGVSAAMRRALQKRRGRRTSVMATVSHLTRALAATQAAVFDRHGVDGDGPNGEPVTDERAIDDKVSHRGISYPPEVSSVEDRTPEQVMDLRPRIRRQQSITRYFSPATGELADRRITSLSEPEVNRSLTVKAPHADKESRGRNKRLEPADIALVPYSPGLEQSQPAVAAEIRKAMQKRESSALPAAAPKHSGSQGREVLSDGYEISSELLPNEERCR